MKQPVASEGHVTLTVAGPATTTLLITSKGMAVEETPESTIAAARTFAVPVSVVTVTTPRVDPPFLRKVADHEKTTVRNLHRQRASRRNGGALEGTSEKTNRGRTKNGGNQTSRARSFHVSKVVLINSACNPVFCPSRRDQGELPLHRGCDDRRTSQAPG